MAGKVKKYKKYLTDLKVSVQRTTVWRKGKCHNTSGAKSASIPALTVLPDKRRKFYTKSKYQGKLSGIGKKERSVFFLNAVTVHRF